MWKKKFGLLMLGLVAAAGFFEVSVRLVYWSRERPPPYFDESLRNEWRWALRSLSEGGPKSIEGLAYDSLLGHVQQATPHPGSTINSDGMRSKREFSRERTPSTPRIVLVGDSLIMGATVEYDDAFHAVLEREFLSDQEVLNFGTSGYGADQALLMWEERGVTYRPDIAVFGFYHRDFLRNALFFKSYLKPYFTLREDDSLELHTEHLMSPQALHEEYVSGRRRVGGWHYSQGYAAVHRILTQWRWIDREDADWRRMAAILRRFRDSALEVGAQPFLLVIPEQGYKVQGGQFEDIDRLALAEARTLGLPALSIREAFNSTDDRKRAAPFFRADGHLTEVGNCEMARHLAMALEDQGLVGDALGDPSGFSCAEDVR